MEVLPSLPPWGVAYIPAEKEKRARRSPTRCSEQPRKWHHFRGGSSSEIGHMVASRCKSIVPGRVVTCQRQLYLGKRSANLGRTTLSLWHKSQETFSPNSPKGWRGRSAHLVLGTHERQGLGNGLSPETDLPPLRNPSPTNAVKQQGAQESIFGGGGCTCVGETVPSGIWSVSSIKCFYFITWRSTTHGVFLFLLFLGNVCFVLFLKPLKMKRIK